MQKFKLFLLFDFMDGLINIMRVITVSLVIVLLCIIISYHQNHDISLTQNQSPSANSTGPDELHSYII